MLLTLPLPPSVNAAFTNVPGKGRVRTAKYRKWAREAGWLAVMQRAGRPTIEGPFSAIINVSASMDIDNVVKACLDLCQSVGLVTNDRNMTELHVYREVGPPGVRIQLTALK